MVIHSREIFTFSFFSLLQKKFIIYKNKHYFKQQGNRCPLQNVILQDVIVHDNATVNDIKKVVSFLSTRLVYSTAISKKKLCSPKKQDASQITTIPDSPLMFISTPRRKLMPIAETKNIQWTSILPLSSVVY